MQKKRFDSFERSTEMGVDAVQAQDGYNMALECSIPSLRVRNGQS